MSYFLRKTILFGCCYGRTSKSGFLRNPYIFPLRLFSNSSDKQNFIVPYLIDSLGFSPEAALSASNYLNFESPEKPDKVVDLFEKYGFTQIQISNLVRRCPKILSLDADKIILPKLEFFKANGISGPEMAKKLSVFPSLLQRSLSKTIIPSYELFRELFQSDDKAIIAIKQFPDILRSVEKNVAPNVSILREHGVPDSNIAKMIQHYPKAFTATPFDFRKLVEKVVDMGFDASKVNFVVAVHVFRWMSESVWESKVDAYKKWGFSNKEVLEAFKKCPWFMMVSEDKLMACMDFFTNEMGWRPCLIAKRPMVLTLSLKKRVIPRCLVFQVLLSKGLVKKEVSLSALLESSEKKFLQKFVTPYKEEAEELLKLYKEKLDLLDEEKVDEEACRVHP